MTPIKHPLCNDVLRRPPGTTEEECGDLHIMRADAYVASFWKPDAQQLALLNQGEPVVLIAWSFTHPPISVGVHKTIDETETEHLPLSHEHQNQGREGHHQEGERPGADHV